MSDAILKLRKLEFPDSLKAALVEMAHCLTQGAGAHIPGLGNDPHELAKDVMHEFIFFGETKKLNPLYELQILEVMCNYVQNEQNIENVSAVFSFIFSGVDDLKQDLLNKLVSMAIGVQSKKMLDWAASWMQENGCGSQASTKLAHSVVQDYCILVPGVTSLLLTLPQVSHCFASCFLTAVSLIYGPSLSTDPSKKTSPFPKSLLKIVTDWIHKDSTLCLATLKSSRFPDSRTPIPGLTKYCVLEPCADGNNMKDSEDNLLQSQLHLGILQSFLYAKDLQTANGILSKSNIQELVYIFTKTRHSLQLSVDSDIYQTVVNRLAQILQVAMVTKALPCTKDELRSLCKPIKPTRLMEIVLGIQSRAVPMDH